jgi:small subunit ribosomal protein S16
MATRIRLARHGKKRFAYYHIVVADSRSSRDGKIIERLGEYNPNDNPATINLDFDRALHWLQTGAQPSDTARAILSYKGVLYKNHLVNGVAKGAHTEEEVEKKFEAWVAEKDARIQAKRDSLQKSSDSENAAKLAAEAKVNEERAKEILAKQTPPADEPAEGAEAPAAEVPAEAPAEAIAEAPAAEASAADAPAAEEAAPVAEAPAEEAPVAEAPAPAEEAPIAEAPAAEEAAPEEPSTEDEKTGDA